MKKIDALNGLVAASRDFDRMGEGRAIARVHQVAWCFTAAYVGKATDEEMGKALSEAGVSLKRAQAGRLKWIGGVVATDLANGGDALAMAPDVARMVTAMGKVVKGVGAGAGDLIRRSLKGADTVADAADVLEALVPAEDPAAVLLAKIAALTAEFVELNYVPGDLDAMVEIQRNVATMAERC